MNECLNCGKPVKNKFCNVSCQNKQQNTSKSDKRFGVYEVFNVECYKCGNNIKVKERVLLHPQKKKYYCNRVCANSRSHTDETKKKISESLMKNETHTRPCLNCGEEFILKRKNSKQMTCSRSCNMVIRNKEEGVGRKGGLSSVKQQNRRSKNEVYFATLCENHFNNVIVNEPIFNGWDADVIIEDIKVAVLWNGVWHYKKITESHSVKQVQNRDKIKIKEIVNLGYTPYIIKDMGSEDKIFVESQFKEFIEKVQKF